MEGIYRDGKISEEINFLDCVNWSAEALESIGAYSQFQQKTATATLCNYRVELPCDFERILGMSFGAWPMHEATSNYGNILPDSTVTSDDVFKVNNQVKDLPQSLSTVTEDTFTYLINNNFIYSNLKDGDITLSYLAIPADCDGFPLIPDNYYYVKAIKAYITYMFDRMQWRMGNIADKVYMESKDDWQWYIRAAKSAGSFPNIDGMENFKNMWLRLYPQMNQYNGFFRKLAAQERIKNRI